MGIKQTLQPDHIPVNKYLLQIVGMPDITFTKVSGIEYQLDVAELPDRTTSPGGNAQSTNFTAEAPLHHESEHAAMEVWFQECQDPISPGAKKQATLMMFSGTGIIIQSYSLVGMWPSKRKLPDLDFEDEGKMAVVEWEFQVDSCTPL